MSREASDGSKAGYYDLPEGAKQLGDLIAYRNLNHADGEMFCAIYRKGRASHSDALRDAKKVLFYAQSEVRRLEALQQTPPVSSRDEAEFPLVGFYPGEVYTNLMNIAHPDFQVLCFGGPDGPNTRMSWQDVAKLSAVYRVFMREGDKWLEVRAGDICAGMFIEVEGVRFQVVEFMQP